MRISHIALAVSAIAVSGLGLVAYAQPKPASSRSNVAVVYKTSSCGCCKMWVEHLKKNGFEIEANDVSAAQVRSVSQSAGLSEDNTSCHTARIGGYIVEGHVPAADIQRMLKQKPAIAGIAAPGMPMGSPGMEQGGRKEPFEVIAFTKDGKTSVFAKH